MNSSAEDIAAEDALPSPEELISESKFIDNFDHYYERVSSGGETLTISSERGNFVFMPADEYESIIDEISSSREQLDKWLSEPDSSLKEVYSEAIKLAKQAEPF